MVVAVVVVDDDDPVAAPIVALQLGVGVVVERGAVGIAP